MFAPRSPQNRPPNRLAASSSPYLLQHAHNPVDWFPWGDVAFAQARLRDVPIFLSIGYSTCYWCHVMERESFEDAATATLMNERMVCVKLDREERPDLDDIYMAATVAMTGQGGWPMSVFLEPDTLRPFFCGTYYPKEPMHGRPTFTRVVEGITDAYRRQRADVRAQATRLAEAVDEQLASPAPPAALGIDTVEDALSRILAMFDPVHGGFGSAPKFPQAVFIEFLLDVRGIADGETRTAIDRCVKTTLDAMATGGIRDHVGGGFHRYSVDATWTVPHFEKMLYDQAQMLSIYARAADVYADDWYRAVARATTDFVVREMSSEHAGFHAALDAEVDGREGLNYLWSPEQVRAALTPEDAAFAMRAFGLDQPPNFRDPHHPEDAPAHVLRLASRPEPLAASLGMPPDAFDAALQRTARSLLAVRDTRPRPRTDTKVIACWNALFVPLMCRSGHISASAQLLTTLSLLTSPDNSLLRTTGTPGFLEDHAAMISACIAAATAPDTPPNDRTALLSRARTLTTNALDRFTSRDADSLRAFDAPASPDLFVRACSTHDGAMPCGFSLFLHALLDLAVVSDAHEARRLRSTAASLLRTLSARIAESPVGCVNSVRALLRLLRAAPGLATTLADAAPSRAHTAVTSSATVVEVLATDERIAPAENAPAQLSIRVRIKPGHHLIAAEPGDGHASLVPFRVGVFNGTGVVAYADYPPGTPLAGPDDALVYTHDFDLTIALERKGPWSGTPLLFVQFQACSETACLAPTRVELDIALERA